MTYRSLWLLLLVIFFVSVPVRAEVLQVIVDSRTPFEADVQDKVGPYERIRGRVVYALDPNHKANKSIVDLSRAATNGEGLVEFYACLLYTSPSPRD